jgi:arsenite/tail-anchored protein-transporting ATPase
MNKGRGAGVQRSRGEKNDAPLHPRPPAPPRAKHIIGHQRFSSTARYLFFGGKGGVGKTTAASAAALFLLKHARSGEQFLLFSTDPAHSLSDSLGVEIGDRTVEVARNRSSRLFAREMDAAAALKKFKSKHHRLLSLIAERGTFLDESDVNELLNLSLPGLDEVMALFELSELDQESGYARIIVDTAPSGHTSRLLQLPDVFASWLRALDRMEDKHRYMIAQLLRGTPKKDEVELFLGELGERIERVRAMLFDPGKSAFTLVTVPEGMSVEETSRYFGSLQKAGANVTDLIVNRVESEHRDCKYCRARASAQSPWLKRIKREFKGLQHHCVPLMTEEVRGLAALRRFARLAWGDADAETRRRGDAGARRGDTETRRNGDKAFNFTTSFLDSIPASPRLRVSASNQLLIFGGKGGVGKTTAAAAAALALAESDASARVLVFSTDPAHSLSDSFKEEIGELKRGVAGQSNLDAVEVDPGARFDEMKLRFRKWTDELFESLTAGSRWEIQFDREAMREIISLAPPGIDEIAALSAIIDLLDEGMYKTIVLDTAPTGHLLRFLELPQVALSWVRTFIKLLLKYKNVVQWSGIAEELLAMSKNIKRVAALLADSQSCEFIAVAIPERMSLEETIDLTGALKRLKVPMRRLLINNLVPARAASGCAFCAARRRRQEKVVEDFQSRLGKRVELFVAPQLPHEIRGRARLQEHFKNWQPLAEVIRAEAIRNESTKAE